MPRQGRERRSDAGAGELQGRQAAIPRTGNWPWIRHGYGWHRRAHGIGTLALSMAGDATLFAREDYVEEAWRIVNPVLKAGTRVFEYEPRTWGPTEVERVTPVAGWENPVLNGHETN